jgi:hypothetical protein
MDLRLGVHQWQKTVLKIVGNPVAEVIAAIVVVLFAAFVVVDSEAEHQLPHLPAISAIK